MKYHPAALVLLVLTACGDGSSSSTEAVVAGADGSERLRVNVTLAEDEESRRTGLTSADELPADEGLLIVLPTEGEVCITNRSVRFAIDAVFADEGGGVNAVEIGVPAGDATARCHGTTRRILEVASGVASSVVAGDRLLVE